jgi:peptidoglycan hydrolase-like protein with peptidoglycan-binding domain
VLIVVEGVGLYKLRVESDEIKSQLITVSDLKISSIAEGYLDDIWLGTNKGVHRVDASNLTVEHKGLFLDENILCIYSNGYNVFAGTESGKILSFSYGQDSQVIRNGGKTLPFNMIKKGDGLAFYHGSSYYHTAYYQGGKRYSDSTTGRSDEIKASMTLSGSLKSDLKLALRYVGPGRDYLSRGASGTAVKKIQKIVGCEADGEFGPITEAAVKKWQKAHGLKDDGLVGPKTLAKMKEA